METVRLKINGMSSETAMRGVVSALSVIRGVATVRICFEERRATVSYDPQKVLPRQLHTAVRVMGCDVDSLVTETAETLPPVGLCEDRTDKARFIC